MHVQAIAGIQARAAFTTEGITQQDSTLLSIDDRLRDAFVSSAVDVQTEYASIMGRVNDVQYLSTPGGLFELQVRLGEYKQHVEAISALTRKGVATVETLLRS